jgi:hypothetical protein
MTFNAFHLFNQLDTTPKHHQSWAARFHLVAVSLAAPFLPVCSLDLPYIDRPAAPLP